MSAAVAGDGLNDVYETLERYDWDSDAQFQAGLRAILGANTQSPEQSAVLTLHARCFYWNREKKTNIDFNAYQAYRKARNRPPPTPPTAAGLQTPSLPDADFPPVKEEAASGIMPAPASADEPPAPYPTSFAHIVELITSGKPVPGIKEIPPTILEGQGTQANKPKRRKPWEKDDVAATQEPALSLDNLNLDQSARKPEPQTDAVAQSQ